MVTEARETGSLTGSDKVEGTAVYGADDTKIGSIERVMIDKMTGKVSYAVLSFGGLLGLLAGIVMIRIFLSFSLETEIEGCWPWRGPRRIPTRKIPAKH